VSRPRTNDRMNWRDLVFAAAFAVLILALAWLNGR
jgi:hypothetical protein